MTTKHKLRLVSESDPVSLKWTWVHGILIVGRLNCSISQEICTRFLLCCAPVLTVILIAKTKVTDEVSCDNIVAKHSTIYPKEYAHGFVVLCFVVVMQSFIMNSHEVFIHIHQGCFAGTGAIVRLPQCQWSKPHGYGKISQCITTTKHSKARTVYIFLGIYCTRYWVCSWQISHHNTASNSYMISPCYRKLERKSLFPIPCILHQRDES